MSTVITDDSDVGNGSKWDPLFSSKKHDHETPDDLFTLLNERFDFAVDLAATKDNRKLPEYIGPDHEVPDLRDSLALPWHASDDWLWLNPPYGADLPMWVAKCHRESKKGAKIVLLVPARTDTGWWHEHAAKAEIRVELKGRLKFKGQDSSAPFPSVLFIWCGRLNDSASQDVIMWDKKSVEKLGSIVSAAKLIADMQ